ncbi:MAG: hypothetical protein ACF8R7_04470 [Phycisphaerales bacterium JB039]
MNVGAIQSGAASATRSPLVRAQETFAQVISRAQERPGARTRADEARASAEQLVSIALIEPALRMVRESSMAAGPFAPTAIEQRFGAMLDSHRAVELARSVNMPLVDRIARDMLHTSTPSPAPGSAGPGGLVTFPGELHHE